MDSELFIRQIAPLAQADMERTGVLASITIAQACLESAYGTSDLAVQANNLFGMKASLSGNTWYSEWTGATYAKKTAEQTVPGKVFYINADFRKYETLQQGITDHSHYLVGAKNGNAFRYAGLVGEKDPAKAAQIIKAGGYATDISYVEKLCNLIE